MLSGMGSERRKSIRLDHKMLLAYEQFDESSDQKEADGMARTLDFSVGGMLLELPHPAAAGKVLKCSLNFDGVDVEIVGEVTYVKPTETGMFEAGVRILRAPAIYGQIAAYYFPKSVPTAGG